MGGRAVDIAWAFVRDFMHGAWDDLDDMQVACMCDMMMGMILRERCGGEEEDEEERDGRRVTMQALMHVQLSCTPHSMLEHEEENHHHHHAWEGCSSRGTVGGG